MAHYPWPIRGPDGSKGADGMADRQSEALCDGIELLYPQGAPYLSGHFQKSVMHYFGLVNAGGQSRFDCAAAAYTLPHK